MGWSSGIKLETVHNHGVQGPVLSVLKRNYSVKKMNTEQLESFVTRLVQFTSRSKPKRNSAKETYECPRWWPKRLAFRHPVTLLRNMKNFCLDWHSTLEQLVEMCSHFYSEEVPSIPLKLRAYSLKKREKKTNENLFNSSKNRTTANIKVKKKKGQVLGEILPNNSKPFVRLYDVLKPRTVAEKKLPQADFMDGLGLMKSTGGVKSQHTFKPGYIRLTNFPQVPFSSDCGRIILKRDCHIPIEFHIRKQERLEWFLKETPTTRTNNSSYPISYDPNKDEGCDREYKFPKRQFYQVNNNSHYDIEFMKSLCKPACVRLEKLVLPVRKASVVKDVKVLLSRMPPKGVKRKKKQTEAVVVLKRLKQ